MKKKPAIFLDRDGVINKDTGYVYRTEDFFFVNGVIETIRYFNESGFWVFVITNQSGVARGYYREEDVQNLHQWINCELALVSVHIDDFYYCPHHPEGKVYEYSRHCNCRKPEIGLLQMACEQYPINWELSFMVGDKQSDMDCAGQAGLAGYLFTGSNLYMYLKQVGRIK